MFSGPNHIAKKSDLAFSTWPPYSYVYYRFSVDIPWGSVIFPSTVLSKDKTNMHTRTHAHIHTTNKKTLQHFYGYVNDKNFKSHLPPVNYTLQNAVFTIYSRNLQFDKKKNIINLCQINMKVKWRFVEIFVTFEIIKGRKSLVLPVHEGWFFCTLNGSTFLNIT